MDSAGKQIQPTDVTQEQLNTLGLLCGTLQHLESSHHPIDPRQYRLVVGRLSKLLSELTVDAQVRALLCTYPAAAELFENINYAEAGLCLHDLSQSSRAERAARQAIDAVRIAVR